MRTLKFVVRELPGGKTEMVVLSEDDVGSGTDVERRATSSIATALQWLLAEYATAHGATRKTITWDNPSPGLRGKIARHFKRGGRR